MSEFEISEPIDRTQRHLGPIKISNVFFGNHKSVRGVADSPPLLESALVTGAADNQDGEASQHFN